MNDGRNRVPNGNIARARGSVKGRTMDWLKEYRIGIRDIDEEHQAIAQCISNIEQAAAQYDRRSVHAALVRLGHLAQAHFTLEESLMRIHDYPRLEEHADEHKQFSVAIRGLQEHFLTANVFHDRIHFLHEWWDEHIQKHDKPYALHFLKRTALGRS